MFTKYDFSKSWRSPADFPAVETDEAQVRDDLQILHDESRNALWALIDALADGTAAAHIGAADGNGNSNLQTLLTSLRGNEHSHADHRELERIAAAFAGLSPTNTLNDESVGIPTAKAVLEQLRASGAGDMLRAIYDPQGRETDIFARIDSGLAAKAPAGCGLGETVADGSVTADADEAVVCGWYRVDTETANGVGAAGLMRVDGYSAEHVVQTVFQFSLPNCLQTRQRSCLNGVWGAWEWINPPMQAGVEYRTTQRHRGKTVYAKYISLGSLLAAGSTKSVALDISALTEVVDYQVLTSSTSGNVFVLPRLALYDGAPAITGYISLPNKNLVLQCIADQTGSTGMLYIKYTKD